LISTARENDGRVRYLGESGTKNVSKRLGGGMSGGFVGREGKRKKGGAMGGGGSRTEAEGEESSNFPSPRVEGTRPS